jgi:hypothetical protein
MEFHSFVAFDQGNKCRAYAYYQELEATKIKSIGTIRQIIIYIYLA